MDADSLTQAVDDWASAWSASDHARVLALWDSDDQDAAYLPAESEDRLVGSDAVSKYVTDLCSMFPTIRHRPETVITKRLADDIGLAFYVLNWAVADARGPIGGRCRVTAVWRLREGTWKLTEYAEAPLAPLVELKEFYQTVAEEGLPA